ncbi:hypothetical protein ACQW02_27800 [Humitalea sp. 24SJ18S-53]|uniref:hypothetical protein n=1 Tax=Humitalea sp. 24SJ18S-53 TaxID=3422307 RepID=UPI003D66FAB6
MTAALIPAQSDGLARICGMFGNAHDGQRVNAAVHSHRRVREAGLTWQNAIVPPPDVVQQPAAPPKPQPSSRPLTDAPQGVMAARVLERHRAALTAWQEGCLEGVIGWCVLTSEQRVSDDWLFPRVVFMEGRA